MKTKCLLFLVISASFFMFWGCASDSSRAPSTGVPLVQLDVFRDGNKPTRAYKEIQLLTDEGRAGEQGSIEAKMLKKAKSLGGSGVIFVPREQVGSELSGFGLSTTFLYKASVITYTQ
jgi:hypothetical protein